MCVYVCMLHQHVVYSVRVCVRERVYIRTCVYTSDNNPTERAHDIYVCVHTSSLMHPENHFFSHKSQSMIEFSRSLLPCSVEKRPTRLRLEIDIE